MCGKDLYTSENPLFLSGSPPHVRERLCRKIIFQGGQGITPACAGKTMHRAFRYQNGWDHPRMCGKDPLPALRRRSDKGSPPHVRERLSFSRSMSCNSRITPACAGKTSDVRTIRRCAGDHPRMCRKDLLRGALTRGGGGSPPHVRERLSDSIQELRELRITPACAGKTSPHIGCGARPGDHPRMCGKDRVGPMSSLSTS